MKLEIELKGQHVFLFFLCFNGLLGPCNFTIVNLKHGPTTLTLSHATLAQALNVSDCLSCSDVVDACYLVRDLHWESVSTYITIDIKNVRQCY